MTTLSFEDCIDWRPDTDACSGAVEYRMSVSPSGKNFPRCDRHWGKRLVEEERLNRDFPDSPIPPAWFDPAAAGERWDDDY